MVSIAIVGSIIVVGFIIGEYIYTILKEQEKSSLQYMTKSNKDYEPVITIDEKSSPKEILIHKFQKDPTYLNSLFMLGVGLGFFGLYKYYSHNYLQNQDYDPYKVADLIEDKMPWVLDNQSHDNINDCKITSDYIPDNINQDDINPDILTNIDNINNKLVHDLVPDSYFNQPTDSQIYNWQDIYMNNDSLVMPDGSYVTADQFQDYIDDNYDVDGDTDNYDLNDECDIDNGYETPDYIDTEIDTGIDAGGNDLMVDF